MTAEIIKKINALANNLYSQIARQEIVSLKVPSRSVSNLIFDPATKVYCLGNKTVVRTISKIKELKTILQIVALLNFIKQCIKQNEIVSLRETYYSFANVKINGVDVSFSDQSESNKLIEEIECLLGASREEFNIIAEASGAQVYGPLKVYNPAEKAIVNYQDNINMLVPTQPEKLVIKEANFNIILVVETMGIYHRIARSLKLNMAPQLGKFNPLIVCTKGVPSRATRVFTTKLSNETKKPVLLFTDTDLGGLRIALFMQSGAANSAHISGLPLPHLKWLNDVEDIVKYNLPSEVLSEQHAKLFRTLLRDPRVKGTQFEDEINKFLTIKREAEGEAFAREGLHYLTEQYLPLKIRNALKKSK